MLLKLLSIVLIPDPAPKTAARKKPILVSLLEAGRRTLTLLASLPLGHADWR